MSRTHTLRNTSVALTLFVGLLLAVVGCSDGGASPGAALAKPATTTPLAAKSTKGRAQIWSENCMRCHNMRPPDWYSDAEWDLAMQHMRVRGYLTGQQQKEILELLQASN